MNQTTARWVAYGMLSVLLGGAGAVVIHEQRTICYFPRAVFEMRAVESAIREYHSEYAVPPMARESSGDESGKKWRETFGHSTAETAEVIRRRNAEVIMILMARTNSPNGEPVPRNREHGRNPRKISFLDLTEVRSTNESGLGPDGCLRDPWGNPYVISVDVDNDGVSDDPLYDRPAVARSTNRPWSRGPVPSYAHPIVWSMGPDGKAEARVPADAGVNADNILSWD